ncbi:sigma-54-dependent transcriptional regulator [Anaeroselena agilis]|uniref:Sigma-54 dependent transcriptional regulator n=1 Tax=Anaeroselena agilis TaxID=3063788 RepID=A0ABU3NZ92_9FIRM|nr:sigma-54 dependent transcriptional regulator [Selenomonadales bacterium 4137-cl]
MNILLVEDDGDSRAGVAEFLRELGHQVAECGDGEQALALFAAGDFPMVLSDIKMPRMSGIELLKRIRALGGEKPCDIVLFTGHGDMVTAIEALRAGAYDYLLKPISVAELAAITERIAEHQSLLRENRALTSRFSDEVRAATEETRREMSRLKKLASQAAGLGNIAFFAPEMRRIAAQAARYHQDRSIPVLIEGETGTGKEIIARIIHYGDCKDPAPLIDVNCAALTASLFESEFFGYEPGAFTGGLAKGQKGKLDLAQGGTVLLDEVGELPVDLQGKLLRVIQEKQFYRVGGLRKVAADVRIICATNADLGQRVERGTFRKDLFYRLKVGHIVIPPLRQRREEILPLAELFLREFAALKGRRFKTIDPDAADLLLAYDWPGNVRELRNTIEWVAFMFDDVAVQAAHLGSLTKGLPPLSRGGAAPGPALNPAEFTLPAGGFNLEDYVDRIVQQALTLCRGNKTAAARYLGISRRSLYCRLERIKNGPQPGAD